MDRVIGDVEGRTSSLVSSSDIRSDARRRDEMIPSWCVGNLISEGSFGSASAGTWLSGPGSCADECEDVGDDAKFALPL
jgi:hypothetical protein